MSWPRDARRGPLIALACVLLTCAIAGRIWVVNSHAIRMPVEHHSLNEAVDLGGAFSEYVYEHTDGYAITVSQARRMSVNEYLDAYAAERQQVQERFEDPDDKTDLDAPTLLVLDIEIRNDKAEDAERGYLDSIGWNVKSATRPELWIRAESALLDSSIPQADGAFQLSIKPGTTFTVHVPFSPGSEPLPFPASDAEHAMPTLDAGSYSFVVTKAPVRKVVDFSVS